MPTAGVSRTEGERAGRSVWVGIIAGLGFVVTANAVMITIAVRNPPALATEDHYGDGMRYDEVIASRTQSEALGWRVVVEPCRYDEASCRFRVEVRDAEGRAVPGLAGDLSLRRADTAAFDRVAKVKIAGPEHYEADVELGAAGLYEVSIDLRGADGHYTDQRRLVVEGGG